MTEQLKNNLKDKLFLELLDLIEQSVLCKVNVETATNAGQLLLAKSRYIQGPQSVSKSRLPTENSANFQALSTVVKTEEHNKSDDVDDLELHKQQIDREAGFIDPIRWFGVLVPRSLQLAQQHFNRAVEIVVESANIHLKLNKTIENILLLRNH